MAEYIEREAAQKILCGWCGVCQHPTLEDLEKCDDICPQFARIPNADVVEVVRCKDCKYCIKEDDYEFWCNGFCSPARLVNPEDFCSHGFNKSELCCCLNGTSEEAEAAIERVKARIGRVNNG